MTDVAALLEPLSGEMPNRDGVLAPLAQQIAQAVAHMDAHDMRSAIATAQVASEAAHLLQNALHSYRTIRTAIVAGRNAAQTLEADGYRMNASHGDLDQARTALEAAATAMQQGTLPQEPLDTARRALESAQANGPGVVQLRDENAQRIVALEQRGDQLAAMIAEGQRQFDEIATFAESTWSDIRGNGTEAQKAADQAEALWQRAANQNTMEVQGFTIARDDLAAASEQLDRATTLIKTIGTRLSDLQSARAAAQDELAAAAADIAAGQRFIQANDADIAEAPEQRLQRAVALLHQAQAEAANERPDWIALVRLAQTANAEADAALADARSEVETIAKLRTQIPRAQQVAVAEVQKIEQFAHIHPNDLAPADQRALDGLRQQSQQAAAALQRAASVEDQARRRALEDAFGQYTALQGAAAQVYDSVYGAFQRNEELRQQLGTAHGRAVLALNQATQLASTYASLLPANAEPLRLIERANDALRRIDERNRNEATTTGLIEAANQARIDAEQAAHLIRTQYTGMNPGPLISGDMVGPILGELLDPRNQRQRRHGRPDFGGLPDLGDLGDLGGLGGLGGWGSPRGNERPNRGDGNGSRSGGSWGGGSRSGGSWGSGSRGGGDWGGGGGRSGGGW